MLLWRSIIWPNYNISPTYVSLKGEFPSLATFWGPKTHVRSLEFDQKHSLLTSFHVSVPGYSTVRPLKRTTTLYVSAPRMTKTTQVASDGPKITVDSKGEKKHLEKIPCLSCSVGLLLRILLVAWPLVKRVPNVSIQKICANRRKNPVDHKTHGNRIRKSCLPLLYWIFRDFLVKSSTSSTSTPKFGVFCCPVSPAYTAASSNSLGSKPPGPRFEFAKLFPKPIFLGPKNGWATKPIEKGPGLGARHQIPSFCQSCGFSVLGKWWRFPNSWIETTRKPGKPAKSSKHLLLQNIRSVSLKVQNFFPAATW